MTAFSDVIYLFPCEFGHKYIAKTRQHLGKRVKQQIPESLVQLVVSPTAPPVRRGRGGPPKQPTADTCVRDVRRSDRVKAAQSSPPTPLTTIHPEIVEVKSASAITKHNYNITT